MSMLRVRWAAIGAVLAICLGAGTIGVANAVKSTGERAVYSAIEPCRLLDTRPNQGIGGRTTPLGPAEVYPLTAHGSNGQCVGIPNDTVALELNVTGLLAPGATHFTIWDGQGSVPNASHLNLTAGHGPAPNSVTTDLAAGSFAIFNNSATTHAIIDIVGIYQDHNHDDRYLRSGIADSMSLPGGAFTVRDGALIWQSNTACFRPQTAASGMRHAIPLTTGAVVTSIGVRASSPQYPSQFALTLFAQRPGSTAAPTVWAQTFPMVQNTLLEQTVDIPDEVVDAGEALYIAFTPADNVSHLCAVTVNFNRPG